jgi:hypothetical protein
VEVSLFGLEAEATAPAEAALSPTARLVARNSTAWEASHKPWHHSESLAGKLVSPNSSSIPINKCLWDLLMGFPRAFVSGSLPIPVSLPRLHGRTINSLSFVRRCCDRFGLSTS